MARRTVNLRRITAPRFRVGMVVTMLAPVAIFFGSPLAAQQTVGATAPRFGLSVMPLSELVPQAELEPLIDLTPLREHRPALIQRVDNLSVGGEHGVVSNAQYEQEMGPGSDDLYETKVPVFVDELPPPIPWSAEIQPNRLFPDPPHASSAPCVSCGPRETARGADLGIGHERVMFAPMIVAPAIAANGLGMGLNFDNGLNVPDRAEYFWATDPNGPGGDPSVNVIDTQVRMVFGSPQLTGMTRYTMRSLDPTDAANTTGFGDMMVGVQSLMLDGQRLKVASLFQTHLATGSTRRGLGVGHTSLQPGVLFRYCASPSWFWFGEVSYLVPVGGNRPIDGNVLTSGLAVSTIAWENDSFAALPTLELRTLTFTSGGQTDPDGQFRNVDGRTAVEFFPGMRFVLGPALDWGLCEVGVSAGTVFADDDWFDSRILVDLRFVR